MDKVTADALSIDPERVADEIGEALRRIVSRELHRRGAVVGVSGGVDSSVTAGLCAHALGSERTLALLMPEADSDPDTLDISPRSPTRSASKRSSRTSRRSSRRPAATSGGTRRSATSSRSTAPAGSCKIVLPSVVDSDGLPAVLAGGAVAGRRDDRGAAAARAVPDDRRGDELQAAHAEDAGVLPRRPAELRGAGRRTGSSTTRASSSSSATAPRTSSRSRTSTRRQVYALGRVPRRPGRGARRVLRRPTRTRCPQSQEEFYFSLPYEGMDLCLYAHDQGLPPEAVADAVGAHAGAGAARLRRHRPEAADDALSPPGTAAGRAGLRRLSRASLVVPGRARRGASGSLSPQSASAGPNSLSRGHRSRHGPAS